jgi:hypothetical protein
MSFPLEKQTRNLRRQNLVITASSLTLSSFRHGQGRLLNCQLAAGQAFVLPASTGKKGRFRLYVGITYTGSTTIHTAGSDIMQGNANVGGTTSGNFNTASNTNTITYNGSTTGGVVGTYVELEDVAKGVWSVRGNIVGSGTAATPFSNS